MKTFKFEHVRNDQWGNGFVHCPVCNWTFKREGIRHHIQKKSWAGDKKHNDWLKQHPWHRGTRTPAVPNVRPQK